MSHLFMQAAQEYIESYNFHLFPLKEKSKKPATRHGLKDAVNNMAIALGWWTKESSFNIGLRTGEISGVWVLDVDGESGKQDLIALEIENGELPLTPSQKTANGLHYFFRYPPGLDIKNRTQLIRHESKGGLDVRGNGGYVVLPPSIHPDTGMPYEWVLSPSECPFADAPQWLIDLIIKEPETKIDLVERQPFTFNNFSGLSRKSTSPETIINDQLKMVRSTSEGGRNHALNIASLKIGRVIGSGVVDDGTANNAIKQLAQAAKAAGLDDDEIMPTINSGLKFGTRQPYKYGGFDDRNNAPKNPIKQTSIIKNPDETSWTDNNQDKEKKTDENPLLKRLFTISQIKALPPITWLIDRVFPVKSFGIIYGVPGAKKSFLAIDMALSIAFNQEWHEKTVEAGSVLYIAGEGVGGLNKRISAWMAHYGASDDEIDFLALANAVNFCNEINVNQLIDLIDGTGKTFKAIFIDTVARSILGSDENSSTDIGKFVAACDAIKEHTGAAVIGIHHSGKDADRGMRGSSALLGAVDTVLLVESSEDKNFVTVTMQKQKDEEEMPPLVFKTTEVQYGINQASIVLELTDENPDLKVKNQTWGKRHDLALEYLRDCIAISQAKFHEHNAAELTQWKSECFAREFGGSTPESKRKAFERAMKKLMETKKIACKNGLVWILS